MLFNIQYPAPLFLVLTLLVSSHEAMDLFKHTQIRKTKTRSVQSNSSISISDVEASLPVTPFQAKMKVVDQGIQLSVFSTFDENSEFSVNWELDPPRSGEFSNFESKSPGLHETGIELGQEFEEVRSVAAVFDLPNSRHDIKVTFRRPFRKPTNFTQDLTLIQNLRFEPSEEIVYEEGQDFIFHVFFTHGRGVGNRVKGVMIDPDSGRLSQDVEGDMFEVIDRRELSSYEGEVVVKLKDWAIGSSGYAMFSMGCGHDNHVLTINTQQVPVRPSSQAATFPPGYISAMVEDLGGSETRLRYDDDGSIRVFCGNPQDCMIECEGAGERVHSVTLQNSETEEVVNYISTDVASYIDNNIVSAVYSISGDHGTSSPYTCTATGDQGQTDSLDIDVFFYLRAEFVGNESSIRLSTDETQRNIQTAEVTCVVVGNPTPNVTFHLMRSFATYDERVFLPDTTVDLGNNKYMMSKSLTYDLNEFPEADPIRNEIYQSHVRNIYCRADQQIDGISVANRGYYFEI